MLNGTSIAHVHRLARAAQAADGIAPLNEQTLLTLTATRARHFLTYSNGELIAFGASVDNNVELVVHPEHRRRGWGSALLTAIDAKLSGTWHAWAHGDFPAARALAVKFGLSPVRELLLMHAPLHGGDAALPGPPPGYTLATFRPGVDDHAWVALNAAAFADHPEQGQLAITDLHSRMAQPWFDADALYMVWQGQELAAFLWLKPEAGGTEIYVVAVAPGHQGKGLGSFLTRLGVATASRQAAAGNWSAEPMILYTDGTNIPARKAYERSGFSTLRTDVQYRAH